MRLEFNKKDTALWGKISPFAGTLFFERKLSEHSALVLSICSVTNNTDVKLKLGKTVPLLKQSEERSIKEKVSC